MEEVFHPLDSGPLYKETLMGRWPVEPWNTWSTLAFLALVLYWFFKIRKNWRQHKMIMVCVILVGIGFVGGFLYHSFRNSIWWLMIDWVPVLLTANVVALFYWKQIVERWWLAVICTYAPLLLSIPLRKATAFDSTMHMVVGYSAVFLAVIFPLIFFSWKTRCKNIIYMLVGIVAITAAILLRTYDNHAMLAVFPMGTHFLWHTLGAFTCHMLMLYTYKSCYQLN